MKKFIDPKISQYAYNLLREHLSQHLARPRALTSKEKRTLRSLEYSAQAYMAEEVISKGLDFLPDTNSQMYRDIFESPDHDDHLHSELERFLDMARSMEAGDRKDLEPYAEVIMNIKNEAVSALYSENLTHAARFAAMRLSDYYFEQHEDSSENPFVAWMFHER